MSLLQHLVDVVRMVLRLGPIEGRRFAAKMAALHTGEPRFAVTIMGSRHLGGGLPSHAEIHVADDAGAVERAEEVSSDLVLQFLFADG